MPFKASKSPYFISVLVYISFSSLFIDLFVNSKNSSLSGSFFIPNTKSISPFLSSFKRSGAFPFKYSILKLSF